VKAGSVPVPGPTPEQSELVQVVAVWKTAVLLTHVTVSPWLIVRFAGMKQYSLAHEPPLATIEIVFGDDDKVDPAEFALCE
jgi:hypothetical protein